MGPVDVFSLWAFFAGNNVKKNVFALIKGLEALADDGFMMHEDIFSAILSDEAEAFFVIPPFYCATWHNFSLLNCERAPPKANDTDCSVSVCRKNADAIAY